MSAKTANWLDSSAVLALILAEPGFETVRDLMAQADRRAVRLYLSSITLTEVVSSLARKYGEATARDDLRLVREIPAEVRAPTHDQAVAAGFLRARHQLSTADAIIATQTIDEQASLVHKDPEFDAIPGLKHLRLPYKAKTR